MIYQLFVPHHPRGRSIEGVYGGSPGGESDCDAPLPAKGLLEGACKFSYALIAKAYTASGQAVSTLHAMAILQVYQAKVLKDLHKGVLDPELLQELRSATDYALRATKVTGQAVGRAMSTMVFEERHLWLNLAEMRDAKKVCFLDATISQAGLFGETVEKFAHQFSTVKKQTEAIKHILPRRVASASPAPPRQQPPPAPRHKEPSSGFTTEGGSFDLSGSTLDDPADDHSTDGHHMTLFSSTRTCGCTPLVFPHVLKQRVCSDDPPLLIAQTLYKVREDREQILLVAQQNLVLGPGAPSISSSLAHFSEEGPPLSAEGHNLAPAPRPLEPLPMVPGRDQEDFRDLSPTVVNTLLQARAPSTRQLIHGDVVLNLCYPSSKSMWRLYQPTMTWWEADRWGSMIWLSDFLGAEPSSVIPSWDLAVVYQALQQDPFEPLQSVELNALSLKTALLTALTSVKRVGDLQALSANSSCLEIGPADSHVVLRPRPGYVHEVPTNPFRDQVVTLQALPSQEDDPNLTLLCPVCALCIYLEHTQPFRRSEQLFVCYGGQQKRKAVSKQRISHWLVDAIRTAYQAYQARGLPCPLGVRAHSTRGVAASAALANGASLTDICRAAVWATPNTFARFYILRMEPVSAHAALLIPGCPGRGQLCKICTPNFIGLFSKLATPVVHSTQRLRSLHHGMRVTIHNQGVCCCSGLTDTQHEQIYDTAEKQHPHQPDEKAVDVDDEIVLPIPPLKEEKKRKKKKVGHFF
ncbi:hypothetical protein M9458_029915, partial [Cirrhinus mrigala]